MEEFASKIFIFFLGEVVTPFHTYPSTAISGGGGRIQQTWLSYRSAFNSLLLALERRHRRNSAASIKSPVVDEEMMRPGHWLWSVL